MRDEIGQRRCSSDGELPTNALMLASGAASLVLAVARARVQSIVIDEAVTYEVFVGRPDHPWWYPASNNHVLNSLLMWLSTSLFGLSHLTVRAPALIGAAIYISVAGLLSRMIAQDPSARLLLFAALTWNPFVCDFFVAARGYGLALAFLMCGVAFVVAICTRAAESGPRFVAYYALASACLGLSFCSNFSFAFVCGVIGPMLFGWGWLHATRSRAIRPDTPRFWLLVSAAVIPGLVSILVLAMRTLLLWPRGQLWDGATSLAETVQSVIAASAFEPNHALISAGWRPAMTRLGTWLILATLCLAVGQAMLLVLYRRRVDSPTNRRIGELGVVLSATVTLALALHWMCFRFFHLLMPKNRTAIYLVPLCTLCAGVVAAIDRRDCGRPVLMGRRALLLSLGAVVAYYGLCTRLTYFREWQYDADVRAVYAELASLNRTAKIDDVACNWRYAAALNFYRTLSGKETFKPFAGYESTDYPHGKPAYVLYWPFESAFAAVERLTAIYHGTETGVAVAIPFEGPEVYDDTNPRLSFFGQWTRDRQFKEAQYGTLTYSAARGNGVRFHFEGTGLTWVYTRTFNRGIAEVVLDGTIRRTVDLYSPVTLWGTRTSFSGLHAGPHDVEIRVSGRKNSASSGYFVDVDLLITE